MQVLRLRGIRAKQLASKAEILKRIALLLLLLILLNCSILSSTTFLHTRETARLIINITNFTQL
jgi:hypothetical protein